MRLRRHSLRIVKAKMDAEGWHEAAVFSMGPLAAPEAPVLLTTPVG